MFYQQQLLMVLFTAIMVAQQYYATWAYRKFAEPKTVQSTRLHQCNWLVLIFVAAMLALPMWKDSPEVFLLSGVTHGLIYWVLFNMGYALAVTKGKNAFYLGDDANSDEELKHRLGRNAGKISAAFLTMLILGANLIYKLLL